MGAVMNKIIKAAQFADCQHAGQCRKYTGAPYITHCTRVAIRVMMLPDATEEMVCAAWMHDTVEDCDISEADLEQHFGADIARLVSELTNVSKGDLPNADRATRKRADFERLKTVSAAAQDIKCIDRIDNLNEMQDAPSDFKSRYLAESELLVQHLTKARPELRGELESLIGKLKQAG